MSDIPKPPNPPHHVDWRARDTRPAPADGDLIAAMAELKEALANVGELCVKLSTRLSRVQLAMLAGEHKTNAALERTSETSRELGKLIARVESIAAHVGMAAE